MSSRAQKEALRRRIRTGEVRIPDDRFESRPNGYCYCVVCHASGLGLAHPLTASGLSIWQIDHVLEHRSPCRCGLIYLTDDHLRRHIRASVPGRADLHGPIE